MLILHVVLNNMTSCTLVNCAQVLYAGWSLGDAILLNDDELCWHPLSHLAHSLCPDPPRIADHFNSSHFMLRLSTVLVDCAGGAVGKKALRVATRQKG